MSAVKELLRAENDGSISFGDYTLAEKTKLRGFEHKGDEYYVKTYTESTHLEKNGMFVYDSVPGTAVTAFMVTEKGVKFTVEGDKDAQITLELAAGETYTIYFDKKAVGQMTTNASGKLAISVELGEAPVLVEVQEYERR
ncbi:MAG: endosialidase [Lachnospiraceae bacterium]|nr:endosialidase [Lachnospiraceae bacterium]